MNDIGSQGEAHGLRVLQLRSELQSRTRAGAAWLFLIAGLSLTLSVLAFAEVQTPIAILAPLATSTMLFMTATMATTIDSPIALLFALIAILGCVLLPALFIAIAYSARKGSERAYTVGVILYSADAMLSMMVLMWLSFLFHLVVLAGLWRGLKALWKLERLDASSDQPP